MLFLALNTVTSPGDSLQAPALDFLLARHTESVRAILKALERLADKLKGAPVVVALVKEKFLGVGIRCLISHILSAFLVCFTPVLLGFGDQAQQFLLFS